MSKKVKMILYGEPGVGKSVFAGNAPKPFFITTDGNYEWLEGLVPNYDGKNHIQVHSWSEAQEIFKKLDCEEFKDYETIVIDLVEDLYRWADAELCEKSRVKHISELGDYGKGYDILRKPFVATMTKVLATDKNVILLSHETTINKKNKLGVEFTTYQPSKIMSIESLWDKLCGQVRFCVRCFKDYQQDAEGHTKVNRLLHIINQPEEYGTYRISDPNTPETIPLDWNEFASAIGLNSKIEIEEKPNAIKIENPKTQEVKREESSIIKGATGVEFKNADDESLKKKEEVVKNSLTSENPPIVAKNTTTEKVSEVKEEESKIIEKEASTENVVVNEEFLEKCLNEGLSSISEIESKYNIKIEQQLKIKFIQLKMKLLKK